MERLTLSEHSEKKEVFGLCIMIDGMENLMFFASQGSEFSYRGSKVTGPVACHPGG